MRGKRRAVLVGQVEASQAVEPGEAAAGVEDQALPLRVSRLLRQRRGGLQQYDPGPKPSALDHGEVRVRKHGLLGARGIDLQEVDRLGGVADRALQGDVARAGGTELAGRRLDRLDVDAAPAAVVERAGDGGAVRVPSAEKFWA